MKPLDKRNLRTGTRIRFADGTQYVQDSNGTLRRDPPKELSRRDRQREDAKFNRRQDLQRLGRRV